jgi:hypothetical protein
MKQIVSLTIAIAIAFLVSAVTPAAADVSGSFAGASGHVTTGGVSIVKNADGTATVTLADNFSLDNGPDPRVGLGKNGKYRKGTDLGALKSVGGSQSYIVPASVNIDDLNEVYIWCREFSVPLGVARLN